MTQLILSSMDSDEVNSIGDTVEAGQVARVIKQAYFNIIARSDLPEHTNIFALDSSTNSSTPVLMTKPNNVNRIEWIKYDRRLLDTDPPLYEYVTILPLDQFLDNIRTLSPNVSTNVDSMEFEGYIFSYKTNVNPCYCTILNDRFIIFDSINLEFDTVLQSSKTLCFGQLIPTFLMEDNFIPDLDDQQFPLLVNEAKSLAFLELKQMTHEKAEQESRRQWRTLQRTKKLADVPRAFDALPNFGRRQGFSFNYYKPRAY